jgi:Protein of unknown function (DUF3106)
MMRTFQRSVQAGFLAAGLLLASGAGLHAQKRTAAPLVPRRGILPIQRISPVPAGAQSRIADLPQNWVEQLQEMTPAQQQRFLKNNARFRSLPPKEQAVLRRRLRTWNDLSPDQREALLERQQIWEQLPPEQRRQVRESLLPRWQSLPVSSRRAILGKLRELRGLDGAQRSAKLSDEAFLGSLNAEERQMLLDLSNLGVGEASG